MAESTPEQLAKRRKRDHARRYTQAQANYARTAAATARMIQERKDAVK